MSKGIILVVDDEEDFLKFLDAGLSSAGYEVLKASTAVEGIRLAVESNPELIIMDVMMPDIGGGDAVKELKSHEKTKDIPVIFLTAMMGNKEDGSTSKINVDDQWYPAMAKPFEREELLKKIEEILGDR